MSAVAPATRASLFRLYRAGEHERLAALAESLLPAHADDPLIPSLLGAARQALGDPLAAAGHYRAALSLQPGNARVHNSLGVCLLHVGEPGAASECFRAALRADPVLLPAQFNLGLALAGLRRWGEAGPAFEAVLARQPEHPGALSGLADCELALGRPQSVDTLYRRALAVQADYLPAHRGLMDYLDQANRTADLDAAVDAARAACGDIPLVRLWQGILADRHGDTAAALEMLTAIRFDDIGGADLLDERRRLAQLARARDRLGDAEAAFEAATAANRITARVCAEAGIEASTVHEHLRRSREQLEAGIAAAGPASEDRPVFVIGFPRSGTTLLDSMLRGHPGVAVAEEFPGAGRLAAAVAAGNADLEAVAEHYRRELAQAAPGGAGTVLRVDRFAMNLQYVVEVLRVFPRARFVLVLRDPPDCVLSACMQTFFDNPVSACLLSLEDATMLYERLFGLWQAVCERLEPVVLALRYEALVREPEAVLRELLGFLGLDWHAGVLAPERVAAGREFIGTVSHDQVIFPVHADALGRWRRYRVPLAPVLPRLERWRRALGYE